MASACVDTYLAPLDDCSIPVLVKTTTGSDKAPVQAAPVTHAESVLNAILNLLERNENNYNLNQAQALTLPVNGPDVDDLLGSSLEVDHNAQLVSEIRAVAKDFLGKQGQIPRSGVENGEIELPQVNMHGQLPLIQRVSDTETDPLDIQLSHRKPSSIRTDEHVDNFDDFVNDMMIAGRRSRTRKPRYNRVQALLISWKEDEDENAEEVLLMNKTIEAEVRTVHDLLEHKLNFSVDRFAIPIVDERNRSVNSQNKLLAKITNFVDKYEDEGTLLIIYYNGHGSYWDNSCYWHPTEEAAELYSGFNPTRERRGPTLEWNPIQNSICTKADVLIILDCCYSGASLTQAKGPRTTTEILTACGKAQKTPAGPNSFSMRLVDSMNELLRTKPTFPITELYSHILGSNLKPDPLHVIRGPGSIVIERQPGNESSDLELQVPTILDRRVSTSSSTSANDHNSEFSGNLDTPGGALTDLSSVSSNSSRLVILAIRVKEDVKPSAANWTECIRAFPDEVEGLESVRVEAAFPTGSTMLIVSMPISLWLLLPENPAYTFLGFVKGSNFVVPRPLHPAVESPREPAPQKQTDSNEITFKTKEEADIVHQLIAAMLTFFQSTKAHPYMTSKRAGKFQQIATKIGFHTTKTEPDSRLEVIRHIVQRLVLVRDEKGEYTSMSYDLRLTEVKQLFELTKNSVKETIHKVNPKNNDLAATITEFERLENKVLTKLEAEKRTRTKQLEDTRSAVKTHALPRSNGSGFTQVPEMIPEEREDAGVKRVSRTDSGTSDKRVARTNSMLAAMRPKSWGRKSSSMSGREILRGPSQGPESLVSMSPAVAV
ncbi:hypothetical protein BKA65DRAFT_508996 [Rhexocercosporidium sp. MPI-PUGE-AT-0058]|nr:hypothetical protein BKA65DRAFT_508996 [Rhexocercosporidium sp. MPI-PUGE-AT-0058]